MNQFSSTLRITNIDDYISPSVECIKPTFGQKTSNKTSAKIIIKDNDDLNSSYDNKKTYEELKPVEINLSDCLACSGCITSAETVLVTQQSYDELLKIFEYNKSLKQDAKKVIVSIALQPILSLSIKYSLRPEDAAAKLASFFKSLGADYIMDMTLAHDLAISESCEEFLNKLNSKHLPVLASNCPGFVCYAEKKHGDLLLPFISKVKSPQQIMGSLVKKLFWNQFQKDVYHITLMACYDKKLEAFREQFFNEKHNIRDVDCVITSIEIEQLLQERNEKLSDYNNEIFHEFSLNNSEFLIEKPIDKIVRNFGSGSEGYSDSIFSHAVKILSNESIENEPEYKIIRNPDFKEIQFNNSNIQLKFCIINGFKNIQNFMQKFKAKKLNYDYIEIMACPSGCLNGGAQNQSISNFLSTIVTKYKELPISKPFHNDYKKMLEKFSNQDQNEILYTTYKPVKKSDSLILNINW